MEIKAILNDLMSRFPVARGVILTDWEGEAVDYVARMDDFDLKVLGAHIGIILSSLRQTVDPLSDHQGIKELVITTASGYSLVCPVTEEYFIVMTMHRQGLLGRALFECRRVAEQLKPEIL